MNQALPEYDASRVYESDIKKLIKWYTILRRHAPEVFENQEKKSS